MQVLVLTSGEWPSSSPLEEALEREFPGGKWIPVERFLFAERDFYRPVGVAWVDQRGYWVEDFPIYHEDKGEFEPFSIVFVEGAEGWLEDHLAMWVSEIGSSGLCNGFFMASKEGEHYTLRKVTSKLVTARLELQ